MTEVARPAFDAACALYWQGLPGPYVLDDEWTLATYEALAATLETKWRLGWANGKITLYGDPAPSTKTSSSSSPLRSRASSGRITQRPQKYFEACQRRLFSDKRSTTHRWKLAPSSSTLICKEADAFFRTPTNASEESGLAIEIAHLNESFPRLCREVINWTSGVGDRGLLGLGIKVDTKPPYQRDPRLRLVVKDSAHTRCKVYEFGHGSSIVSRRSPHSGPPTAVVLASEEQIEGCDLEFVVPADPQAEALIVELPIGAALFHDLQTNAFRDLGVVLSENYVEHLKGMSWMLDLGYLRHEIVNIVQNHAWSVPSLY
ncbi:hypothetical protein C8R44DRAFT_872702 [Mycena epipterygia]|nr:hypothetical protein C8R44DRAFT_872702 [Mycena epipterygia]